MPTVFMIYDTERQMYWQSSKGRQTWSASWHAKNAWNHAVPGGWRLYETGKFEKQTRFVCHKFDLSALTPEVV